MSTLLHATTAKREYHRLVADETMEDFALRFTAHRARRWSAAWVANAALGSISFLALEAIGAALTLGFGFSTAALAIAAVCAVLFVTGLPIAYYAARYGVDIDLLTRGAGFGYLGSTLTSLIYASFTFIFFALEAAILSLALQFCFGIPLWAGYMASAVVVIPLVAHGFSRISRFQAWTQIPWLALNLLPFAVIAAMDLGNVEWTGFRGLDGSSELTLLSFGAASAVGLSMIAQIGEQVDFLRFLPAPRTRRQRIGWWAAIIAAGPGWAVIGGLKMMAGSFLTVLAISAGTAVGDLTDPAHLYFAAFDLALGDGGMALAVTGIFIVLCQLKINVTNAYAGSIAWSNFFSRLTHAHPGRVVWLVFNVAIAFLLMQFGVFHAIEATLSFYSTVALAWIGAIFADLVINKPLGFSPAGIEFRRAYLYDLNPVGLGSMLGAVILGLMAGHGLLGHVAAGLSAFVALGAAIILAPLIAWASKGRFYIARQPVEFAVGEHVCDTCGYPFEAQDMATCPFIEGQICSLCCSLEGGCGDRCKPHGRAPSTIRSAIELSLPAPLARHLVSRAGIFSVCFSAAVASLALLLAFLFWARMSEGFGAILGALFCGAVVLIGVGIWMLILGRESRHNARDEAERQTLRLLQEIRAHKRTDLALQAAKEQAEAANTAKTRYLAGLSHEIRTPLNAIFGFAQIVEADPDIPPRRREAVRTIRRSSEHLAGLIEGLLDISKIEVGQIEITRERINLPGFLNQIGALFRQQAAEKGLDLSITTRGSMPVWVMSDEKRLRQILINLMTNAVRYTAHGSVELAFSYRNEVATIVVTDTGQGIAPEQMERIWRPFERGGDQHPGGSGLGLTITKLLVDILGGEITAKSMPGRGSSFRVRLMLPSVPDHAARPGRQVDLDDKARPTGYGGRRRTLMIVDDDLHHLNLFDSFFAPLGFNVVGAADTTAARAMLGDVTPDLFVLDVDMPVEDGWSFALWLRRDAYRTTPILMCTGHALEAGLVNADMQVHDGFLVKPYTLTDMLETIASLLRLELTHDRQIEPSRNAHAIGPVDLEALLSSARIGHARGVAAQLDRIEIDHGGPSERTRTLRSHLENYDLTAIEKTVTEWMNT
ncbi:ATP-binding protein [Paracoccus sp. 1_MG-2023]|uniref:hybrid sensor histidine kinase/response regulator n=1 Tax=unclassified Paracoccus (in: a-proteobacteria) TaxID=2688777 RepID=UPI001C089F18|nr:MULTISPECIES: ATP-binding protein [unclassified Paracoccus (in: a-proteobacteria)]MBU2957651.1 response regulator [Paracoccus sp. C2R09]MDO6667501.1 ATP-binding protein [Paracoccus sp. 1_MG-2023]